MPTGRKLGFDMLAAKIPELKKETEKEQEAQKKVQEARAKAAEALAARQKEVDSAQDSY